jgi:prophage regulatory protein
MKTKTYPEFGFLRLRDVIGDKGNPGIIPVSRSSRVEGVAEGRYPKPVKLGERMSAWRVEDIRKLVEEFVLIWSIVPFHFIHR